MITVNIVEPITQLVSNVILAIPGILFALLILVLGWFVAKIIKYIVVKALKLMRLEEHIKRMEMDDALGGMKLTNIAGALVYWWIFLIFIGQAAQQVNMGAVSELLVSLIAWTPNLFFGVIIMVGGLFIADFITDRIKKSKSIWADRFGYVLEPIIIVFVAIIALEQIGFNITLITDLLKILFTTMSWGLALAFGLAFGLGMKDRTPKMWDNFQKEWNKKR